MRVFRRPTVYYLSLFWPVIVIAGYGKKCVTLNDSLRTYSSDCQQVKDKQIFHVDEGWSRTIFPRLQGTEEKVHASTHPSEESTST